MREKKLLTESVRIRITRHATIHGPMETWLDAYVNNLCESNDNEMMSDDCADMCESGECQMCGTDKNVKAVDDLVLNLCTKCKVSQQYSLFVTCCKP